jgi:hypothetical protein
VSLTVLFWPQALEIIPSKSPVTGLVLLLKADYGDQPSELVSGNERQIAACRRYIHSPSRYAGWAVAVFGWLGARRAERHFLDWAFRRPRWRAVVYLGLV